MIQLLALISRTNPHHQHLILTNMADDNEAELIPIDDSNYYGLIRLRKELKKHKFAYIHEIIHYIFDVGYGNKVDECFFEKRKEKPTVTKSKELVHFKDIMNKVKLLLFEEFVKFES